MQIGIGLPATIPGIDRESLLEWAKRAERRGFSSLAAIDRLVYPNYEPLMALCAAASVTSRIRLTTAILIAPLRLNAALLAKQCATLQHLSQGRLVLGLALGGRDDDYTAAGLDPSGRGAHLDAQIEEMLRIWGGDERGTAGAIGPAIGERPELMIGGHARQTFRRAARYADGWMMGGGSPQNFSDHRKQLGEAWEQAGRSGAPRTASLAYFALGDRARQDADWYLRDYYAFLGEAAEQVAASAATDPDTVGAYVSQFDESGCDELLLFPCSKNPDQVDLLADACGM